MPNPTAVTRRAQVHLHALGRLGSGTPVNRSPCRQGALDRGAGLDRPRQRRWVSKPNPPTPAVVPSHATADTHEPDVPPGAPQISEPPSPSAAPSPAYPITHNRHLGVNASSAAGSNQRAARLREKNSRRRDDIGGLIVTIVIADPPHVVFETVLVPTFGHEVEQMVGGHNHLHTATIG